MTIRPPGRPSSRCSSRSSATAGRAFADHGLPEIAAADPGTVAELEPYRAAGAAWVAVDDTDPPIAYILTAELDDGIHVDQVSVDPAHAARGIGAALIDHVAGLARASGRTAVTLTTFRDIPWNAPYYARLGFRELPEQEWGPQLRARVAHERAVIPGDAPRVAMIRRCLKVPGPASRCQAPPPSHPTTRRMNAAAGSASPAAITAASRGPPGTRNEWSPPSTATYSARGPRRAITGREQVGPGEGVARPLQEEHRHGTASRCASRILSGRPGGCSG